MQAILNNKHKRFCDWLQNVKVKLAANDNKLDELESRLLDLYTLYLLKRDELKYIIDEYEKKQKDIRNRVKALQKKGAELADNPANELTSLEITVVDTEQR